MRRRERFWRLGKMLVPVLMCALVALACADDTALDTRATPTSKATASTANPLTGNGHACTENDSGGPAFVTLGDLEVTKVDFAVNAHPFSVLDNPAPNKPYKVPSDFTALPLANPDFDTEGGGYYFSVCNASKTASHTINSVLVSIEKFTPDEGAIDMWQACDSTYQRPTGATPNVCNGVPTLADEFLMANFYKSGTEGGYTATQEGTGTPEGATAKSPPLPVVLAPGQHLTLDVLIEPPTQDGWYTFAFSLSADGGQPQYISSTAPVLKDLNVNHQWNGQACASTASMLAQIPTADTTNEYVCPK